MPPRDLLIERLHDLQDRHGGLYPRDLDALAAEFALAPSEVFETASFYAHFRLLKEDEAPPAAVVRVCRGPACEMRGAAIVACDWAAKAHVEDHPCLGRCDHAPAILVETPRTATASGHGYLLLGRCRSGGLNREAAQAELEAAGLRGMGGAGFPTARKWRTVAGHPGPRFVVVNADEGEPGTFKDRHFLETAPARVLEGALIAAWVVEAEAVYLYLRDEYPHIRAQLMAEIAALPPGLPPVHLRRGAGAYVCGEESALIESLEGKRGLPRQRPPYVAEAGLFGRPTLVNNVETLYWVCEILDKGAAWFADHGRHGHSGLRAYSVSGRVKHPGVRIAPNGITITELIDEFCGGMEDGHSLAAYLPGGASGGFLPAHITPPLAFGAIEDHGGFIGSAAVTVFSQADDLRAAAAGLARFFAHESCGQCTPCRLGTARAAEILDRPDWDIDLLGELAHVMREASICGLGQAAPNVWQSLVRHFPEVVR
ncbi:NADH-ubiquinone oxidoreductase-F iron-sulfur binding region domain-containing protein [Magnetospirillum sp. SS-4]|uniref:NADH-ubiquinone oxidoreductase-F iron-sulfur binding region domain-containing protein n=1 Tax=Magnetospirillum sp. SS-4 TaxID=2681465 RepID=UPI00138083E5|nr:NADH-ubiquinone oxidoreductase-F iron-sulfur binding region domain-containing protein [Magnetospirillum sp. SS-4]CAA7627470.1 NADH:ubiquinone oxidoreductase [Magnetospirillum sp. SS-4]